MTAEAGKLATEKDENQEIVSRVSTRQWAKQTNYDPVKIFNKLFNDDIKYLLSMAKLWETRTPPTPLDWSTSLANTESLQPPTQGNGTSNEPQDQSVSKPISHKIWTISECCKYFSNSVSELSKRIELQRLENEENPILAWDKDDEDAMNFVTAAANLRCFIFSIGPKSKFETKCKLNWLFTRSWSSHFNLVFLSLNPFSLGRKHHSSNSDNQCHRCWPHRLAGSQSPQQQDQRVQDCLRT